MQTSLGSSFGSACYYVYFFGPQFISSVKGAYTHGAIGLLLNYYIRVKITLLTGIELAVGITHVCCGLFDHTTTLRDCVNKVNLESGAKPVTS